MAFAADILHSLVPISQFNKGQAAKIFDRLHSEKEPALQVRFFFATDLKLPDHRE